MSSLNKDIEKKIAQQFLDLYNAETGHKYQLKELGDKPDVICVDSDTEEILGLEVTLFEDLPGQIPYLLGKGDMPVSPSLHTNAYTFDDVVNQIIERLKDKLLCSYGPNTALVFYQVTQIMEPKEWTDVVYLFLTKVFAGKEENYGAGVWIICADNSAWPSRRVLFCLHQPIIRK